MFKVEKRDGTIVDFSIQKIQNAIKKAFESCKMNSDPSILELLALRVSADFQPKIHNEIVSVEDIQDSVERILSLSGYTNVSKSYILYRKQRENVRRIEDTTLDYKNIVDSYLHSEERQEGLIDSSLYSVGGLILSNSGAITRNYWCSEVYDDPIVQAHNQGKIHIHDLDMLTGDSASWSIFSLIQKGIQAKCTQIASLPAKHLMTLCNQMVNILGILQNEWAGAQSFSHFDTALAPYVKKEDLSDDQIKKALEAFIYGVNIPSRWGTKTPFGNVVFDIQVPEEFKDKKAWVGSEEMDFTYGQCQDAMKRIHKIFFDILLNADLNQTGFPFPIPTICLPEDFDFQDPTYRSLFACAGKYGSPYFVNAKKQQDRKPGYYSYPQNSGSIGTVTINLVRIAYLAEDEEDFFHKLKDILDLSIRSLDIKRQVLSKLFDEGLYPYTKWYIADLNGHYSTIGIVGMNEAGLNAKWLLNGLRSEKTQAFAKRVLAFLSEQIQQAQAKNGILYNLEATPAESVSARFAKLDAKGYPDMPTSHIKAYTNSTWMPIEDEDDLFSCLSMQEQLQEFYSGGSMFSIDLSKGVLDVDAIIALVETIHRSFSIANYTLSPVYSICAKHGYLSGWQKECPQCHEPTTIWARIAGYYHALDPMDENLKPSFYHID